MSDMIPGFSLPSFYTQSYLPMTIESITHWNLTMTKGIRKLKPSYLPGI